MLLMAQYEPGEAQITGHVYLIPDNIFHMAWSACVGSSKYSKKAWLDMEVELAEAYDTQINGGFKGVAAVRECLGKIGGLMRVQEGKPDRIQKTLAEAEENAREQMATMLKTSISATQRSYVSYLNCLAWEEVENMRKVLGLPEGTR